MRSMADASDEQYYAQALDELESGTYNRGLWAKVFCTAQGQEEEAKALYMKYRVAQLEQSKERN